MGKRYAGKWPLSGAVVGLLAGLFIGWQTGGLGDALLLGLLGIPVGFVLAFVVGNLLSLLAIGAGAILYLGLIVILVLAVIWLLRTFLGIGG
jgi:hypothetical protein